MSDITDAELAEWERLAGEATAGPWRYALCDEQSETEERGVLSESPDVVAASHGLADVIVGTTWIDGVHLVLRDEDAAFIAAAREALPRLVAEVRRLRSDAVAGNEEPPTP